jgi:hypothetical protein
MQEMTDPKAEARARGLTLVDESESARSGPTVSAEATPSSDRGFSILALALKTMGQRALIAVDNLFTLVTVCLAFYLWHSIPEPNTLQVVALALFALFVLAANVIVRGWRR